MEGIPVDFAPREPATQEEWERFYEDMVRDFMVQKHGGIVSQVDITAFAVEYLHMRIVSAAFAEESENLTSFLADGTSAIMIRRNGELLRKVYPPGTIVVSRPLCQRGRDDDVAYYRFRFAVAVECAKWICRGFRKQGIAMSKQGASRLLMPRFLVMNLLDKYYAGQKIIVYGTSLCRSELKLHAMANSLGVNYSPMFYRLQALHLLDHHPISELVNVLLKEMREVGEPRQEAALQEEPLQEEDSQEEPDEDTEDWPRQSPSDSVGSQQTSSQVGQPLEQGLQTRPAKFSYARRSTAGYSR